MWILEVINEVDPETLTRRWIYPHNVGHLWGILTAPFLHVSFQHLIGNTVPVRVHGGDHRAARALRLIVISVIVILVGGIGTWLMARATPRPSAPAA